MTRKAERAALRLVAQTKVGQTPIEGRERPEANALKLRIAAEIPRVAEDAAAVASLSEEWYHAFKPQNSYHAWMVDQISLIALKMGRNARTERRLRDVAVLSAETSWDLDRCHEVEEIGWGIMKKPGPVVKKLRKTLQGREWLIDRWTMLERIAEGPNGWNDYHLSLAFNLLGTPEKLRHHGSPGQEFDRLGQPVGVPLTMAQVARREIALLEEGMEELADADALNQCLARADYLDPRTPEYREVRRYEAVLQRRFQWFVNAIRYDSPRAHATPAMRERFEPSYRIPVNTVQPIHPVPENPVTETEPAPEPPDDPETEPDEPLEAPERPVFRRGEPNQILRKLDEKKRKEKKRLKRQRA